MVSVSPAFVWAPYTILELWVCLYAWLFGSPRMPRRVMLLTNSQSGRLDDVKLSSFPMARSAIRCVCLHDLSTPGTTTFASLQTVHENSPAWLLPAFLSCSSRRLSCGGAPSRVAWCRSDPYKSSRSFVCFCPPRTTW